MKTVHPDPQMRRASQTPPIRDKKIESRYSCRGERFFSRLLELWQQAKQKPTTTPIPKSTRMSHSQPCVRIPAGGSQLRSHPGMECCCRLSAGHCDYWPTDRRRQGAEGGQIRGRDRFVLNISVTYPILSIPGTGKGNERASVADPFTRCTRL